MPLPLPTIASRVATTSAASFPRTLEKLDLICRDDAAAVPVVAAVAGTDPLLTALLIGQASAGEAPRTLEAAIMKLGLDAVRGLFRAAAPIPEDRRKAIATCWGLAGATATMAPIVARGAARFLARDVDGDLLALAAVLHDIGTALAILHYPDEHRRASARCALGDGEYASCLRSELGVSPSDLGLILARAWRLPEAIQPVMRWHANPTRSASDDLPFDDLCAIVHVARLLVRAVGFTADGDPFIPPLDEAVMSRWALTTPMLEGWLNDFYTSMEELELYESVLTR